MQQLILGTGAAIWWLTEPDFYISLRTHIRANTRMHIQNRNILSNKNDFFLKILSATSVKNSNLHPYFMLCLLSVSFENKFNFYIKLRTYIWTHTRTHIQKLNLLLRNAGNSPTTLVLSMILITFLKSILNWMISIFGFVANNYCENY